MDKTADDLLSRLQAATGPSRELDAEIALANYPWMKDCPRDDREGEPGWTTKDGRVYTLRYTESIDAALTLKPSGYHVVLRYCDPPTDSVCSVFKDGEKNTYTSRAATPAIALLIAIERAKEDSKP